LISLTEDGYVKVEGRQKDQINRGGEKIAAEEIENLLLRHPEVINAALVSMPDELMGEKSCAYIIATSPIETGRFASPFTRRGRGRIQITRPLYTG
jgi:2,3-dihydroxybenzoate-AMP ligase